MELRNCNNLSPGLQESFWQARLKQYRHCLAEQKVSPHTKRAYGSQLEQFVSFLEDLNRANTSNFQDSQSFENAVREYRDFLKHSIKLGPSSINNSLIAIDHFCHFLGMKPAKLEREQRDRKASKILTPNQMELFLKAVKQQKSARDKALALVLLNSGMRIGECAALNAGDVSIDGVNSIASLRRKRLPSETQFTDGGALKDADTTQALQSWLIEREKIVAHSNQSALWVTQSGSRLGIAGIDYAIRRIGWQTHLVLSAEILRQTRVAHLVLNSSKEVLAKELGNYMSLSTMSRYHLPGNREYQKIVQNPDSTTRELVHNQRRDEESVDDC